MLSSGSFCLLTNLVLPYVTLHDVPCLLFLGNV